MNLMPVSLYEPHAHVTLYEPHAHVILHLVYLFLIDGRPPEIPITETSEGLYHVSVEWNNVLVPLGGELQGYRTYVYNTTNSLVYSVTVDDGSITEYTFSGLEPDTQYRFSVVGFNIFGDGNVSNVLQVNTLTPLGKYMYTFT